MRRTFASAPNVDLSSPSSASAGAADRLVGPAKGGERGLVVTERLEALRPPAFGERSSRGIEVPALDQALEAPAPFVEASRPEVDVRQRQRRSRVVRPAGEDSPAERGRLLRPRAVGEQLREPRARVDEVGVRLDRRAEVALRVVQSLFSQHEPRQVEVGRSQARRARERRLESLPGAGGVAEREVHETEIVVHRRVAGIQTGGPVEKGQGAFRLRRLSEHGARQQQGRHVVGTALQDPAALLQRPVEVAAPQAGARFGEMVPAPVSPAPSCRAAQSGTMSRLTTLRRSAPSGHRSE